MSKTKRKKKSRRSAAENPELDRKFALKSRVDLLDQDYYDKLSPKDKKWLNKFNKESISASFEEKGNLHRTKKLKKECYDRNNARNRDILTREKAANRLGDYEELRETSSNNNHEDYIIEKLDEKDVLQSIEWLADELGKDENDLEDKLINELKEERLPRRK